MSRQQAALFSGHQERGGFTFIKVVQSPHTEGDEPVIKKQGDLRGTYSGLSAQQTFLNVGTSNSAS